MMKNETTSRKSSGRRGLGFRVWAMAGLFLLPICILAKLFIDESNKSIDFAARELVGIQYLRSVWPVLLDVSAKPATALDTPLLKSFNEARKKFDPILGTAQRSSEAARLLPYKGTSQTSKLEPLLTLITEIGERSNLILDPRLDSYYLVDSALVRLPEIAATASLLASLKEPHTLTPADAAELYSSAFRSLGRLQTAIESNAASQRAAAKEWLDNPSRTRLTADLQALGPVATAFHRGADLMVRRLAVRSLPGGEAYEIMQPNSAALLAAVDNLWLSTADQLATLLEARKASFQKSLWFALAASGVIVLVALGLALFIFRRIMVSFDEQTVYLSRHDAMTKLLNRATFVERLDETIAGGAKFALHSLDLDRFKQVNDTHGHEIGDALLKAAAERLLGETRGVDLVARLGGDEFVVVQLGIETAEQAAGFADRAVKILAEPYAVDGREFKLSASIGTACHPADGADATQLMKAADLALYQAKADGRNVARVFKPAMTEAILERRRIEAALAAAIADGTFELHFQPVLAARTDRLHGFEALIRMKDADGRPISPAVFIPIAEENGSILAIDAWTIRQACKFAATWPKHLSVAVNISPVRFGSGDLSESVAAILAETGLESERLELEVTERLLLDNTEQVAEQFARLRKLGVRILMDDFGAGNSSLNYLWQFPFDGIKIDRSFVVSLSSDDAVRKRLLSSVVTMGHALGIKVTAEGIETPEQEQLMREIACDHMQGYRFARPLPQRDVAGYILIQSGLPEVASEMLTKPSVHSKLQQLRLRVGETRSQA